MARKKLSKKEIRKIRRNMEMLISYSQLPYVDQLQNPEYLAEV